MSDGLTIGLRLGLYVDLTLLFGLPAFTLHALMAAERKRIGRSGAIAVAGLSAAGIVLSLAAIVQMAAAMSGAGFLAVGRDAIDMLVWQSPIGLAWRVRMVALAIAFFAGLGNAWRPGPSPALAAVAGAAALATLAWTGHGAMDEGGAGWAHLLADIAHLLAAGLWIGTLAGLTAIVSGRAVPIATTARALYGFSRLGTVIVATLVITGLINGWMLVGPAHLVDLPFSPYGQVLIAKIMLFGMMLIAAAANRYCLTPRLRADAHPRAAIRALRVSLAIESGAAVLVLAAVAWLGTLAPPVS